jgi:hypothetical protein
LSPDHPIIRGMLPTATISAKCFAVDRTLSTRKTRRSGKSAEPAVKHTGHTLLARVAPPAARPMASLEPRPAPPTARWPSRMDRRDGVPRSRRSATGHLRSTQTGLRRRDQIDHAHNRYCTALVLVRFWHPFHAGPYVPGLCDKLLARPLIDLQLAFQAMAHHVIRHGGVIGLRAGLVDNVTHGHCRIGRDFRGALREIDSADPRGDFPPLVGAIALGRCGGRRQQRRQGGGGH